MTHNYIFYEIKKFFHNSTASNNSKKSKKNNGQLKCETCFITLKSKSELHFDHKIAFARGGRSTAENCQLLCANCNLRKNDKLLSDFMYEEQAKKILIDDDQVKFIPTKKNRNVAEKPLENINNTISKDMAISLIMNFVSKEGNIKKIDLARKKNNLPTITEIRKYWGGLKQMKAALKINAGIQDWNRKTISEKIKTWIIENGNLLQNQLTAKNGLPSLPCILKHYPELKSFTEIKVLFGLNKTFSNWTKDQVIEAGKTFIQNNGPNLRQRHLNKKFNMPSNNTINSFFGSLTEYQRFLKSNVGERNKKITDQAVEEAVNEFFKNNLREVKNQTEFFIKFKYSISAMCRKYGDITRFFRKFNIIELKPKKGSFTKEDIDSLVKDYLKGGKKIPQKASELTRLGLPSSDSICKYYDNWREPFIYFSMLMNKIK